MKYDAFAETEARWLSDATPARPPTSPDAGDDATGTSPFSNLLSVDSVTEPIHLYNNRGFRLRVIPVDANEEQRDADNTESAESSRPDGEAGDGEVCLETPAVVISFDQAASFDWDAREWDEWNELKQTRVTTVDELLVTIAEWATWLGEEDLTGEAGVHAVLNDFMG